MDPLFASGGEMGSLMAEVDWSKTALGPPAEWAPTLRTATRICLESRHPMLIWWGERLSMVYNDAYRPMLGAKHPQSMGQDGRKGWPEIWDVIGPMLDGVMRSGEATWSDDQELTMERNGFREETYFTFSYSPIREESGAVAGVFTAVAETTEKVVGTRRLALLRVLADAAGGRRDEPAYLAAVSELLAPAPRDLPFALLYLFEDGGTRARLAFNAGAGAADGPLVELSAPGRVADVLARVAATQRPVGVQDLEGRVRPAGGDGPRPRAALALPVRALGADELLGVLVAGVNPRRPLDAGQREFLELVAGALAGGLADARAAGAERERAEALAAVNTAKTEFFSNVSHEFRTPLTLLLGPIEDALDDAEHPLAPEQRERLEIARRNALRLRRLVNSLLDFSRGEAGRREPGWEPVDLARLTADLASSFRAAVEGAGLELRVDAPPLPAPVVVDPESWEKVVLNLLSNAFKHTLDGTIAVGLAAAGDGVELRVTDTGTGIADEELPRLFERFHRVRGAGGRSHEGTGIGLAVVAELVAAHGGTVAVQSTVGGGSTFTVRVPYGHERVSADRLRAPSVPRPSLTDQYVADALVWGEVHADTAVPAAAAPPAEDRPRILLADDNPDLRAYVGRLLASAYAVETVGDGAAALERALADPPDLVLSDVMMPGLDGMDLLRALRREPATARTPVVLLSARAGIEASVEALDAGADDYLVKPFSAVELLARVRANVELGRLRERATRSAEDRYDREHALVEELQRSLLPDGLPELPEVDVAARYLPAEGDDAVGGDWYDVVRGPDERIMVVVGDVVGHGMRAAATMAHLRTAVRAYAGDGHGAADLVQRVSRLVERTGVGLGSTLLVAMLDSDSGALEYASAGHPPALVTGPDGPRWLAFGLGPPLGLASASDPVAEHDELAAGETLVLFTDGLIERRDADLEDRLRQVADVALRDGAPAALLDGLVRRMGVEAGREDDVALIAVRRVPARSTFALDLAPSADLATVRAEVRAWLERDGIGGDVVDEVLLAVSEALINAIEHSGVGEGDRVAVRGRAYDDRLRLVVRDRGRWRPQGPAHARGHGLRIIRALMDDVALRVDGDGTRLEIWRRLASR